MNIYRAFPWIGIYLYALNVNGRRKDRHIIFAFFCMIAVFYCLYLSALFIWDTLLFCKSIPKGLDENFYAFIAFLEFLSLLFIRTRSTLKYFPLMSITVMMMFLYYVQFTSYGFYSMGLFLTTYLILGLFALMLSLFEIPGLEWNPFHHYTPSIDSPRMMYFPVFSLSWYHDLPQMWSMFYPLFGRSSFTVAQMSMIDRNYILLNNTMASAVASRNGLNLHNNSFEGGLQLNQLNENLNPEENNINQHPNNQQNAPPNLENPNGINPPINNNNYLIDLNGQLGANNNAINNWPSQDEENNYRILRN